MFHHTTVNIININKNLIKIKKRAFLNISYLKYGNLKWQILILVFLIHYSNLQLISDIFLSCRFCNWFLLTDVLKRLKMSARIFRARYPHLEVVSLLGAELWRQVSVSQVSSALASPYKGKNKEEEDEEEEEEEGLVDLVRCVPELQRLLGSTIHILQEGEEEEETQTNTGKPRSRQPLFHRTPPECADCFQVCQPKSFPARKSSKETTPSIVTRVWVLFPAPVMT